MFLEELDQRRYVVDTICLAILIKLKFADNRNERRRGPDDHI